MAELTKGASTGAGAIDAGTEEELNELAGDAQKSSVFDVSTPEAFVAVTDMIRKSDTVERDIPTWIDEYKGKHTILKRPDKLVGKGAVKKKVPMAKLVARFQEKIVRFATAFLLGNPPDMRLKNHKVNLKSASVKLFYDFLIRILDDNKIEYFNKKLARRLMVETKVAELWYVYTRPNISADKGIERVYRVRLLSKQDGDDLYAYFDKYGNMTALMREYNVSEIPEGSTEAVDVAYIEIYTEPELIKGRKAKGEDKFAVEKIPNMFGKMPVIYYEQSEPEWSGVQTEIDRYETLMSGHADTNDYYGKPMAKLFGLVSDAPDKADDGKTLTFGMKDGKRTGDAEYLTWDESPESLKLEYENLKDIIHSMTGTPDVSLQTVSGISSISGLLMKLMFFSATLKALDKEEIFGEMFIRRMNLLKAMAMAGEAQFASFAEDMQFDAQFNDVMPESIKEIVEYLSQARGGEKIISPETAVNKNPLVDDPATELEQMKASDAEGAVIGESLSVGGTPESGDADKADDTDLSDAQNVEEGT